MKKNRSLSSFIKLPIYSLFFAFIAWSAYWFLGTIYIENKVLENNKDKVEEFKSGKEKLFGYFVGQVMQETKGTANPGVVNDILKKKLAK